MNGLVESHATVTRAHGKVAGCLQRRRGSTGRSHKQGRPSMPGHGADGENLMHLSTSARLSYGVLEALLTVCLPDSAN